jgi:hypothetical protein
VGESFQVLEPLRIFRVDFHNPLVWELEAWTGVWDFSMKGEWITPIGCMIISLKFLFIATMEYQSNCRIEESFRMNVNIVSTLESSRQHQ